MTILSAGIIPVRISRDHLEFLLLRCFKYWDFPKGELDRDENPLTTALRELKEETTLEAVDFKWGEVFYETELYSKGKIARYYIGEVDGDAPIKLLANPDSGLVEHHEFRWVSYAEGYKLANPRIQKVFEWAQNQLKNK